MTMSSFQNFEINVYLMQINQKNEKITTQGVILHQLIYHLPVISEKTFFTIFLLTSQTKIELRTP